MFNFCFRHERYQLRGDCLKFEIVSKSTIANVHKECTEKYTYKNTKALYVYSHYQRAIKEIR